MPAYELRVWCGTGRRTNIPDGTVGFTADTVEAAMQEMERFAAPLFAATSVELFLADGCSLLAATSGGGRG